MESLRKISSTPIHPLKIQLNGNVFYIKRDDLIPYSFGGNKARKAGYFFEEILRGGYTAVVTYGSSSSNHCRVISNLAAGYGIKCYIVSPEESYKETVNSRLVNLFGAQIVKTPLDRVAQTIDSLMENLARSEKPYFIQGGGHGNLGTRAYVDAYGEICDFEEQTGIRFDYIFHASGTGTTQAGLVCGAAVAGHSARSIVGISIARKKPRGQQVVEDSISDYLESISFTGTLPAVIFEDSYICEGYGMYNREIADTVKDVMVSDGIPLNLTYTGKAFYGMLSFLKKNSITNKHILFVNTGGNPLFCDDLGVL